MINNRTKARGCPKCILWGTSAEEIRLRHELVAAGVPIEVEHKVVYPDTGRPLNCDMVVPTWNVVIEFDGHRFHKTAEGHDKDRRKTTALTDAGWTVIRVREGLAPIGSWDVVVPKFSSEVARAKAVLIKLNEVGRRTTRHDDYLATDAPWAATAAETEIRRPRARSLASELPTLAAEWDPVKNAPLTPEHVTFGSGQKAWWLCPVCGNWDAFIASPGVHQLILSLGGGGADRVSLGPDYGGLQIRSHQLWPGGSAQRKPESCRPAHSGADSTMASSSPRQCRGSNRRWRTEPNG